MILGSGRLPILGHFFCCFWFFWLFYCFFLFFLFFSGKRMKSLAFSTVCQIKLLRNFGIFSLFCRLFPYSRRLSSSFLVSAFAQTLFSSILERFNSLRARWFSESPEMTIFTFSRAPRGFVVSGSQTRVSASFVANAHTQRVFFFFVVCFVITGDFRRRFWCPRLRIVVYVDFGTI